MKEITGNSSHRLQSFYDEHAAQARQHENQRERMTNIVLAICGALVGVVAFSKMALWSLPASIAIGVLGLYGLIMAMKHYERNRLHTSILREIRNEMSYVDGVELRPADVAANRSLRMIRQSGSHKHRIDYAKKMGALAEKKKKEQKISRRDTRLIYRLRLHSLWEGLHTFIILLSMMLIVATLMERL